MDPVAFSDTLRTLFFVSYGSYSVLAFTVEHWTEKASSKAIFPMQALSYFGCGNRNLYSVIRSHFIDSPQRDCYKRHGLIFLFRW
jgi:hypothetical protein